MLHLIAQTPVQQLDFWTRLLDYGVLGIVVIALGATVYRFVIKAQKEEIVRLQGLLAEERRKKELADKRHANELKDVWKTTHTALVEGRRVLEEVANRQEGDGG